MHVDTIIGVCYVEYMFMCLCGRVLLDMTCFDKGTTHIMYVYTGSPLIIQWQCRMVFHLLDFVYRPLWLCAWNAIILWHAIDDGEKIEEGDLNFCEAVCFHYKKINYRSGESYEVTYEILKGQKQRICIWCSFILRRLVIGCLKKCVGIVKD